MAEVKSEGGVKYFGQSRVGFKTFVDRHGGQQQLCRIFYLKYACQSYCTIVQLGGTNVLHVVEGGM